MSSGRSLPPPLTPFRLRAAGTAVWLAGLPLSAAIKPPPNALEHWAFQPPAATAPPEVSRQDWAQTSIDRFILAKLEASGASPQMPAEPRILIRRLSLDLTGLPPSAGEVEDFIREAAANRTEAVTRLIDRLLASPHYGERWGRHWLDVARYSDTKGYVYAREERRFVHAPAYRDWVIRAFNEDLPYDRFLLLQLAGDQLLPGDSPDLAAMGFLTGGRRFIGVTHDIIDDRIDVVTRGTMALTVQCARCHDHKYDPVPTADYYSLYGVFQGSGDHLVPLGGSGDEELRRRQAKLAEDMAAQRAAAAQRLRARIGDYLTAQLDLSKYPEEGFDQVFSEPDIIPASVRRWRDFLHTAASETHPVFGPWVVLARLPAAGFSAGAEQALAPLLAGGGLNPLIAAAFRQPPASAAEAAHRYGAVFNDAAAHPDKPGAADLEASLGGPLSPVTVPDTGIINNELFFPTSVIDLLWKRQGEVERRMLEIKAPAALVLAERPPGPNPRIFTRGSAARPGEEVPRHLPEILARTGREPFQQGSGRLELARAIASPGNPLTARVLVNRVWQHHFGTGLVRTASDFGLRAEPPSHPELLDWLAQKFIADGWRMKSLHRLILSSAVYQQSAGMDRRPAGSDPDNRLLSRFPVRRLDFETLRDSMLAVSGELDVSMGGPGPEVLDPGNRRRTVYAYVDRQFLTGTLRTFDFANPDIHVAVRHETTVPQQALFFLNGPFAAARAKALTAAVSGTDGAARVERLYQLIYQRPATPEEVAKALTFIAAAGADQPARSPEPPVTAWRYGTGEYDPGTKRLKSFTPLPYFTGEAWQGAPAFPGGTTGWAQLTAGGGHPGDTTAMACVRRWVAPAEAVVTISGTLKHEPAEGDGIRAFIVSSRSGELHSAAVHHASAEMTAARVSVSPGDTLDFITDIGGELNSDQFLWEPVISAADRQWSAKTEFTGPAVTPDYLTPWEQYVQVLLLTNGFAFAE